MKGGQYTLEKARVGGTEPPVIVGKGVGTQPKWSPKGDAIALIAPGGGVNLVAADGSSTRQIGSSEWLAIAWTRHGSRLLGLEKTADRHLALSWIDVESGAETRISDLGAIPAAFGYGSMTGLTPVKGMSVAPDGKTVTVSMLRVRSDLWLLQGLSPGQAGMIGLLRRSAASSFIRRQLKYEPPSASRPRPDSPPR